MRGVTYLVLFKERKVSKWRRTIQKRTSRCKFVIGTKVSMRRRPSRRRARRYRFLVDWNISTKRPSSWTEIGETSREPGNDIWNSHKVEDSNESDYENKRQAKSSNHDANPKRSRLSHFYNLRRLDGADLRIGSPRRQRLSSLSDAEVMLFPPIYIQENQRVSYP